MLKFLLAADTLNQLCSPSVSGVSRARPYLRLRTPVALFPGGAV